jgi:potassium/hydrogen antiporter
VLVQGTTIPIVARKLGIADESGRPARPISFDTVITGDEGPRLTEIVVEEAATAVGRKIVDLGLPQGVLIVLVRRGAETFMPQGGTVIAAGDGLLVAAEPDHERVVERLFRAPMRS